MADRRENESDMKSNVEQRIKQGKRVWVTNTCDKTTFWKSGQRGKGSTTHSPWLIEWSGLTWQIVGKSGLIVPGDLLGGENAVKEKGEAPVRSSI